MFVVDSIVMTETRYDASSCHYKTTVYNLFFSSKKRNQNDGVMVFVESHFNADFLILII